MRRRRLTPIFGVHGVAHRLSIDFDDTRRQTIEMGFYLSKVAWWLFKPATLFFLLLLIGALLTILGRRSGAIILVASMCLMVVATALPVGPWLLQTLEDRFPKPQMEKALRAPHGIIVLGGSFNPGLGEDRQEISVNGAMERLLAFAALARRYPKAKLVFTGGSGDPFNQKSREADMARRLLPQFGLQERTVIYERESRNTFENARFSKKLAGPKPGERWILVTSARHMPRAVGVFRKAGWPVIPYPVDYITPRRIGWPRWPGLDQFGALNGAAKEWGGLMVYYLMGRSTTFFPKPI